MFEGDTLYARSEVIDLRQSKSRPHQGIVHFKTSGYNQDGEVGITFRRTMRVYRRGQVPQQQAVQHEARWSLAEFLEVEAQSVSADDRHWSMYSTSSPTVRRRISSNGF